MINHARTMLLNIDGAKAQPASFFGEEFVEPAFSAIELPQYLLNIRTALFGGAPDRAGINLRLWQFMRLIHANQFESYVLALDPRVTYLSDKSEAAFPFGNVVTNLSPEAESSELTFIGAPDLGRADGKLMTTWDVEVTSFSGTTIRNLTTNKSDNPSFTMEDGLSTPVQMTGHKDFFIRFQGTPSVGARWQVVTTAKPTEDLDLTAVLDPLSRLGDETLASLFSNVEPYATFKLLWERHNLLPFKLTGLLLAAIYRTNEERTRGG